MLLAREGRQTSASTVGRILSYLKRRGLLYDSSKTAQRRPPALRKPKNYRVEQSGDRVQIDSLDVKLMAGVHFKHFTARDMVSRWDVLQACSRATANHARTFLGAVEERLP